MVNEERFDQRQGIVPANRKNALVQPHLVIQPVGQASITVTDAAPSGCKRPSVTVLEIGRLTVSKPGAVLPRS